MMTFNNVYQSPIIKLIRLNIPYRFNQSRLKSRGTFMKTMVNEEPMPINASGYHNGDCGNNPIHTFIDEELIFDQDQEEDWEAGILPGIIQDVENYAPSSPSARFPEESDEQYEERLMLLMDVTYQDMDQLEADINWFLAEMP